MTEMLHHDLAHAGVSLMGLGSVALKRNTQRTLGWMRYLQLTFPRRPPLISFNEMVDY